MALPTELVRPSKLAKTTVPVQAPPPGSGMGNLRAIGGSQNDDFNVVVLTQAINALWQAHSDDESRNKQRQAALAVMGNLNPRDELEGMLAAQMVATHSAAMECYRRAMISEQTLIGRGENLKHATKLGRVYTEQLEALARHRGKAPQTVRVEHVTVQAGGQAIVGNVAGGPGHKSILEEQPHAQ